jgi:hypothetical protein
MFEWFFGQMYVLVACRVRKLNKGKRQHDTIRALTTEKTKKTKELD